jgi:hypothetical protein
VTLVKVGASRRADVGRVALLSCDLQPAGACGGARLRALVDLGFPCNLWCPGCARARSSAAPNGAALAAVAERLAEAAAAEPVEAVSAVLYGGEPLLDPDAVCTAASAVRDACAALGRGFEAALITNGLLLDAAAARRLSRAGIATVQIGFPIAGDPLGDPHRIARVIRNARAARDELDVLLRVELDGPGELRQAPALVTRLEREGLLGPPRPAAVLLGGRATYAAQARALLAAPAVRRAALAARGRGGLRAP